MEIEASQDLGPLVDAIARRRVIGPAIFLLEMGKPLIGCMRELYTASEPLVRPFFGPVLGPAVERALRSSDETERLIQLLEQRRAVDRPTA